jgi:dienelactone hydrolase
MMRKQSTAIGTWAACGLVCLAGLTSPARAGEVSEDKTTFNVCDRAVRVERFAPKAGRHPALFVLPGALGADDPLRDQARLFARRGYVVLLVHFQDGTDAPDNERPALRERVLTLFRTGPEPRPEEQRALSKAFDGWTAVARTAVRHFGDSEGIDRDRVALVGVSLGGAVAVNTAAQKECRVAAVVNLFGALPECRYEGIKSLPPVLSLHGDLDEVVPPRAAYALEKALRAKRLPIEFTMYQRVGHVCEGATPLQVLDVSRQVSKFLEKHLKPAEGSQAAEQGPSP